MSQFYGREPRTTKSAFADSILSFIYGIAIHIIMIRASFAGNKHILNVFLLKSKLFDLGCRAFVGVLSRLIGIGNLPKML